MTTVTREQLFGFLECGTDAYDDYTEFLEQPALDAATFASLKACDIRPIVVGCGMSAEHLGGDDLVEVASSTLEASGTGTRSSCGTDQKPKPWWPVTGQNN